MSVVLFKATGWEEALVEALVLGRGLEKSYRNPDGERVEWRLAEIATMDELRDDIRGAEVFAYRVDVRPQDNDLASLNPEASKPNQSGV